MRIFLSSIGVSLFLITSAAEAADPACKNLKPVSQYVKDTLQIVDDGIAEAAEEEGDGIDFLSVLAFWIRNIESAVVTLLDTNLRVEKQQKQLLEGTTCLHIDLCIIEAKIEEVRLKLEEELNRGSILAMWKLQFLLGFLNERYEQILLGARDPYYIDPTWKVRNIFGEGERKKEDICPFATDYLPPNSKGFGCDSSVLSAYGSAENESTAEEAKALSELIQNRNKFMEDSEFIKTISQEIAVFTGQPPPNLKNFGEALSRTHVSHEGCIDEKDADKLVGMTAWEIRGPFSTKKDERGILMRLVDLRKSWSERREQPDYLKYPEELGKDENTVIDILEYIRIQYPRNVYFPEWMKRQTIEDAVAIAKSQDAHTQVAELFRPVHTSVSLLTQMASDKGLTGLRGFVRNLAYFLRRSCISRPCNERLERILKTALENDCFPYADGVYLGDPDIHKKCKTAAEE